MQVHGEGLIAGAWQKTQRSKERSVVKIILDFGLLILLICIY